MLIESSEFRNPIESREQRRAGEFLLLVGLGQSCAVVYLRSGGKRHRGGVLGEVVIVFDGKLPRNWR